MKIQHHRLIGTPEVPFCRSPNQSAGLKPLYLIMHYTAGTTLRGAVDWLTQPQAQASAHLVIDRDGSMVQLVAFDRCAWHAGKSAWGELQGMNQYAIGIELVNAGKLRQRADGQWVNWANQVIPAEEVGRARHPQEQVESGWQEYTEAQLTVASNVAALLHAQYHFADVLGHEDVSPGRKTDPGPLFPLNSFRSRVLGRG